MDSPQAEGISPTEEGRPEWDRNTALRAAIERGRTGATYRANLEALLQSLLPEPSEELLMIAQEGRGAFATLLVPGGGRALFAGDSLSGTVSALAWCGYQVTVCDHEPARLAFARLRDVEVWPGRMQHVLVAQGGPFPFVAGAFDVVVAELGPHGEAPLWGERPEALHRLTRDTFVWVTDNALAYKRALGRRGKFEYQKPWSLLQRALRPKAGEGTRSALKRSLLGSFRQTACLALYPHRLECSHVVHLDEPWPQLTVGPKERRNRLKVIAQKMGAFPWLAPSFAWIARYPTAHQKHRLQRVLDELCDRLGGGPTQPEHLIATRGNVGVVHTVRSENHPGWTLHIPLCVQKRRLIQRHFDCLGHLRQFHPGLPVPEPLFVGECQGLWLSAETRLPGHHAPQLKEGGRSQQRMLEQVGRLLPLLAASKPEVLDEERLETLLGDRIRLVLHQCGRRDTARRITAMWAEAYDQLLGLPYQPALYHADLRPKHVQVDPSGNVLGFMDWGAFEETFLPYVDLLHLVCHRRRESARWQWERLVAGRLEPWERSVLDEYAVSMKLHPTLVTALERLYPVLAAGMTERNWEFSRPYWVHKEFGL